MRFQSTVLRVFMDYNSKLFLPKRIYKNLPQTPENPVRLLRSDR
jgi:hypothetical protein